MSVASRGRPGSSRTPDGGGHRLGHQPRVTQRGQIRQPDAIGVRGQRHGGRLQGQPGLADAPYSGQGHQAVGRQETGDVRQLPLPAHEAGQLQGQVVPRDRGHHPAPRRGGHRPGGGGQGGPGRGGQPQGPGQPAQGVRAGGPLDPPLQVADGPGGEPGALGERLLGQPARPARAPQQRPEGGSRGGGHGLRPGASRSPPTPTPVVTVGTPPARIPTRRSIARVPGARAAPGPVWVKCG